MKHAEITKHGVEVVDQIEANAAVLAVFGSRVPAKAVLAKYGEWEVDAQGVPDDGDDHHYSAKGYAIVILQH